MSMESAPHQAAVRTRPQDRAASQHAVKPAQPQKTPLPSVPQSGTIDRGMLDPQAIVSLQAFAGNAAVASLLAGGAPGSTLQRAPAPAAAAAPPAAPAAASSPDTRALLDKLHNDSKAAAHDIREILTGNSYLGSRNQAQIMAIVRPWAQVPAPPGKTMSGMDWLIAGLRQNTYEVGTLVKQTTSAFDELYRRMSSDNVAEFQNLVATSGRQFKNDKPIELAKFEVSQEDIIRGLKAGGELAAAVATGGGSIIWQIVSWLVGTLPGLWSQIKAVFGLMDAIKAFRSAGIGSKFSPAALGTLAISAIFGKLQGLPVLGGPEPPKAEESAGEASGLTKILMTIVHGIMVVKNAYNKVAGKVNGIIKSIDLSATEFLQGAATVYAGVVHAMKGIGDPGSILKTLGDKLHETVGGFFDNIKGHISGIIGDVKSKLELIVSPVALLGLVADRLVSTVLNFIITHPPSALVQTVFQVIQTAGGKELIQVVRDQLKPVGDEIIGKIANSDVVQTAIGPLKEPVHKIADAVGKLTDKGLAIVKQVEEKVGGFLNVEKLREMIHLGPSAAPAPPVEEAAAQGGDFLSVVKGALHGELLAMGTARLVELGKKGATWAWDKVKSGAKAAYAGIKGAIVGRKEQFAVAGEHHELWTEQDGEELTLMVASKPTPLKDKLDEYQAAVKEQNAKENELQELYFQITELKTKHKAVSGTRDDARAAADEVEQIQKKVAGLVQQLEGLLVKGKLKDQYEPDSRGRPILAADMLTSGGSGARDMGAEASVSRPLTQLFEYLQQQGGTWQASAEYAKNKRPTFDAAHLIPHDFGGASGTRNLVPLEARVNKSFMGTKEGEIRDAVNKNAKYYMMVRCVYRDPPNDLARPFRVPPRSQENADSNFAEGTLVRFNLMALERVPDEVIVKVIDTTDNRTVYEENYPTGGPVIDWVGKTRAELAAAGDDRGEQILDPDEREKAIAKGKATTTWK